MATLSGWSPKHWKETRAAPTCLIDTPEISVILPVYRNREVLEELHRRLRQVLDTQALTYEIVFVDDACPDNSLEVLGMLAANDPVVGVVALARNVGQHRAVLAGLRHARGTWVVVMDADLQDPPEVIPELLAKLREGAAAVFAGRRGRYESAFRLFTSRIFKSLLHHLTGVPADAGMFVAMNRQLVERLLSFDEPRPFVVAMIGCTGLPTVSIPVVRSPRPTGRSAYSSWKRLESGLRAVSLAISWKWSAKRYASDRRVCDVPVMTYLGTPFSSCNALHQPEGHGSI